MAQTIGQFDLILISDAGIPYVVIMKDNPTGPGKVPARVEPLDQVHVDVPNEMRGMGVTLAIMPDAPSVDDGCSCFLLNLENIKNAIRPPLDPARAAARRAAKALRAGKTITIPASGGDPSEMLSAKKS